MPTNWIVYPARAPFEAQIGKLWTSDKIMKFHKFKYISIALVPIIGSLATQNTQVDDHSKKGRCGDPKGTGAHAVLIRS